MTKQDFISYLNTPENLNGLSIDALKKLVQEYPYFQTGRMLYLKNLHNENSIEYEKNLHITSAYAPSGKVLYNLIKKKPDAGRRTPDAKAIEREASVISPPSSDILKPIPTPREIPKPIKDDKKDEFDELQILEKEMLREAYRTSMTIDLLEGNQESEIKNKDKAVQPGTRNLELGAYSFNDWMKVVSGKAPDSAIETIAVQKKQKTDIIDRFILDETARSTPKPKVEFYSADTMAKKSILDDETFVSETLASIYLKQGNLPKALRAYEILLVKYPEKIHIFAPLLEKIKKLLESQKGR